MLLVGLSKVFVSSKEQTDLSRLKNELLEIVEEARRLSMSSSSLFGSFCWIKDLADSVKQMVETRRF